MNLQIETVTLADGSKMDVIRDIEKVRRLIAALESIVAQQPCCEGGGCFYPMHDGDGNYIGEQNVDPLGVVQSMVQAAQDGLYQTAN